MPPLLNIASDISNNIGMSDCRPIAPHCKVYESGVTQRRPCLSAERGTLKKAMTALAHNKKKSCTGGAIPLLLLGSHSVRQESMCSTR